MITLTHLYILAGLFFAAVAVFSAIDPSNPKRFRTAVFWGLLAISFLFGSLIGDLANGLLALGLAVLATWGLGQGKARTTSTDERRASAEKRGNLLFLPALIIPAIALLGTLAAQNTPIGAALMEQKNATLISLILGVVIALAVIMIWLKPPLISPLQEGRRLIDAVGWAAILPQMLASLGAVFLAAGVGDQVGKLFADYIPLDSRLAAVAAYCIGMALFTIFMGNAFAAFPVMTAAVGLPIIVMQFGGDPATVCAIGMLAGFCGTLMTPMAANFNVVPANLLELPDRKAALNGVIRAQIPTALPLLAVNIVLMLVLAFPK
ncbi:MAG: hypothetical protein B7Y90_10290 [Alphaproteobacteria bacterium 32-64-14]|nr:MAG: hypothetical protein B7Y90_10290 [Alphaproteobacteria bacterium 32-64-14]